MSQAVSDEQLSQGNNNGLDHSDHNGDHLPRQKVNETWKIVSIGQAE